MPKNRLIPTLGLALALASVAQAQDPAPPVTAAPAPGQAVPETTAPPTAAEKLIDDAVKKIKALSSASADIKIVADMLNQKFSLSGEYFKAPDYKLYLRLSLVGLNDATGTMLQVCDGVTRWNFTKVLSDQHCMKLSITPIFKLLNKPECDPQFREDVIANMGFAGPDALLAGLRKAFEFNQMSEETVEGKPVWLLRGTWKDSKTPVLPGGGTVALPGPLPPYVPSLVTLYLGKDDGWPYKIIFEGRMPTAIEQKKKMEQPVLDPSGRPIAKTLTQLGKKSSITLVYSNVKLNVAIPEETFAFAPPEGIKPSDETDQTVAQLEQIITGLANKKKAEAAKAGPVLDGSLPAPMPPDGGAAKVPSQPPSGPK